MKILVIDDDPDILEALKLILEFDSHDTEITTKAEDIYEKIKDHNPDLIILDVLLSGNDGRVLCKNLKKENSTKHIPVIMISAHPTAEKSVKACGAESFIPKPFSVETILNEVQKYSSI